MARARGATGPHKYLKWSSSRDGLAGWLPAGRISINMTASVCDTIPELGTSPCFQATQLLFIVLQFIYMFVVANPLTHWDLKIFQIFSCPCCSITLYRFRCSINLRSRCLNEVATPNMYMAIINHFLAWKHSHVVACPAVEINEI